MLLQLLLFLIVLAVVWYIITLLPLPEPFPLIVRIVFALIALFWVLNLLGVGGLGLGCGVGTGHRLFN